MIVTNHTPDIAADHDVLEQVRMQLHQLNLTDYQIATRARIGYTVARNLMTNRHDISFASFRSITDAFDLVVEVRPRDAVPAAPQGVAKS